MKFFIAIACKGFIIILIYKTITSCDKPDYLSEEEVKTLKIN